MKKIIFVLLIVLLTVISACHKDSGEKELLNQEIPKINVLLPQTPSSLPLYLALKDNPSFSLDFYLNHSQANAKFLRGDAKLLLTGISLANSFSDQGVEFDLLSSQVDNLTHLVSNIQIDSLADIKNKTIVFPFADSPMELLFIAIAEKNNLSKGSDYNVRYLPFSTSLQLLQQDSDLLVWLPEPFTSIAENKFNLKVSLSLNQLYLDNFKSTAAAQVVLISKELDAKNMTSINYLTKLYIDSLNTYPEKMLKAIDADYPNSSEYTSRTIKRTSYNYQDGENLKNSIANLFNLIQKENALAKRILEFN